MHSILPASLPRERAEFLYRICRAERPRNTLEIGMAWGLSTLFIMRALIDSATVSPRHVVMDPGQTSRYHDAALISLNELGLDSIVEFYPESSALVLPRLVSQGRKFDFAFIDGDNRFASVFIDVYFVNQLVKPGGVIVLDDTIWDGVSLASKFAELEYGYETLEELGKSSHRARIRAYRKPEREPFSRGKAVAPFLDGFTGILHSKRAHRARRRARAALEQGRGRMARRYLMAAERIEPRYFETWFRLMRTYLPIATAKSTSGRSRKSR